MPRTTRARATRIPRAKKRASTETNPTNGSTRRVQNQFLYPPVRSLRSIDLSFRRTRELMDAGKLFELASGAADHTQDFAFQRHFEQPARVCRFADKQHLVRAGRDADRIRRPNHGGKPRPRRRVSVDWRNAGRWRHVDGKHPQEFSVRVEDLNAPIRALTDIDVVI